MDVSEVVDYHEAWGNTVDVDTLTFKWSGDKANRKWLYNVTGKIYQQEKEVLDCIQFIPSNWKRPGSLGFQYHSMFNDYFVGVVKNREGMKHTARHELMHVFYYLVKVYTGKDLSNVIGVDWNDGVVHGDHPKYVEYEYDAAYDIVRPVIEEALRIRKEKGILNSYGEILVYMRKWLLQIADQVEEITESEREKDSLRITLHQKALASIGIDVSPSDLAPDELGCAESVTQVIRKVIPSFPVITGTWTLWDYLRKHSAFVVTSRPKPGDVIISPTGTGNGRFPGHVGIMSNDRIILSNDSRDGKFKKSYTLDEWYDRYQKAGGYPVHFFRIKKSRNV